MTRVRAFPVRSAREARPRRSPDLVESQLESLLNPVQPNPEFVQRLRTRLTSEPSIVLERRHKMAAFVVTAFGLFLGALIVWIVFLIRSLVRRQAISSAS